MKKIAVGLAIAALSFGVAPALKAQGASRSVWSGVFTAAQAERGKALYAVNCARCHGPTLAGGEAPGLAGSNFLSNWNGESIAALVDRIRTSMPADDPGKIGAASATDLVALILSSNQIPAGENELPRDAQIQAQIRLDALKPN